jgi:hypothetical protein
VVAALPWAFCVGPDRAVCAVCWQLLASALYCSAICPAGHHGHCRPSGAVTHPASSSASAQPTGTRVARSVLFIAGQRVAGWTAIHGREQVFT